jgi:hypothetical protein
MYPFRIVAARSMLFRTLTALLFGYMGVGNTILKESHASQYFYFTIHVLLGALCPRNE